MPNYTFVVEFQAEDEDEANDLASEAVASFYSILKEELTDEEGKLI